MFIICEDMEIKRDKFEWIKIWNYLEKGCEENLFGYCFCKVCFL